MVLLEVWKCDAAGCRAMPFYVVSDNYKSLFLSRAFQKGNLSSENFKTY